MADSHKGIVVEQEQPRKKKRRRISDEAVRDTILQLCAAAGATGAVDPGEVARALYPEAWQSLLPRVRLTAKKLALSGYILILRKGKPADPNEFKGVIKLRLGDIPFPEEETP
ncbi:MAG: DUF3253 domain-containing protein [Ardenticatenales bacterium]|nr:DUF3253 domain-containing protein [Ardenticatenales bacterium]